LFSIMRTSIAHKEKRRQGALEAGFKRPGSGKASGIFGGQTFKDKFLIPTR